MKKLLVSTVCTFFLLSMAVMLSGTSAQTKEEHSKDDPQKWHQNHRAGPDHRMRPGPGRGSGSGCLAL